MDLQCVFSSQGRFSANIVALLKANSCGQLLKDAQCFIKEC